MNNLNTKSDVLINEYPSFIGDKVLSLLAVYDTDSLERFGSVIVLEDEKEAQSLKTSVIEFAEKIICDRTVWWHVTVAKSNSLCEEIFLEQVLMTDDLIEECEANMTRVVYEDEF